MKLSEFDYDIPEGQIAQYPLEERDSSRLLVLNRKTENIEHRLFSDIAEYLQSGDVLVLNDTKVMPARLHGAKPTGGKAEITLLKEIRGNTWEALVKGVHEGKVNLEHGITADVSRINRTVACVKFDFASSSQSTDITDIKSYLHKAGVIPLPVYIKRLTAKSDETQYQTVYASKKGAIAAPTAGLHFTNHLLTRIKDKGIQVATLTLHIGYGTFKPVAVSDVRAHEMERERYNIPETTAVAVNAANTEGRRVIAVGTTVTRTLESSADRSGRIHPGHGEASLFIYPGYKFKIINALVTNFHLPKSTPMILASAFADRQLLKKTYKTAASEGYRFYSYGDAMFIV
jgi:S-adenosylmethionine:tRNA ribosyltransferase-isomerase